jgi:hypothetical protein
LLLCGLVLDGFRPTVKVKEVANCCMFTQWRQCSSQGICACTFHEIEQAPLLVA